VFAKSTGVNARFNAGGGADELGNCEQDVTLKCRLNAGSLWRSEPSIRDVQPRTDRQLRPH